MNTQILFDDGHHRWLAMVRDPERPEAVIDTNEYLIVSDEEALLLDPGGTEIFPAVLREISRHIRIEQIQAFFASHQDPDIFSSLPLWLGLCPGAKIHIPWMWRGFLAHYGYDFVANFVDIPDEGGILRIGNRGRELQLVPAHYCHSPGNFSLYDPTAKILFSGDIGAALLPEDQQGLFVKDFDQHIAYMRGFHIRWMPSNEAKNAWIRRVRKLDIDFLCPQHGAIFKGADIGRFLDWFEQLEVGQHKGQAQAAV